MLNHDAITRHEMSLHWLLAPGHVALQLLCVRSWRFLRHFACMTAAIESRPETDGEESGTVT